VLAEALKSKFKNVNMGSPLNSPAPSAFGTPLAGSEMGTPVCEPDLSPVENQDLSACGTPYTEPVFLRQMIQAPVYEGTPGSDAESSLLGADAEAPALSAGCEPPMIESM
jgi:hypothetical protein